MRVTTTKSKSDESFYINYAFINEKGKSTSRIPSLEVCTMNV